MPRDTHTDLRPSIDNATYANEAETLAQLRAFADLSQSDRAAIVAQATKLVQDIRAKSRPGLMEVFLAEYGLSTDEGVALMCLAEALLRVPDAETIDALIEDKIAPSNWAAHLGKSTSPLVNASTWALMLTGRVLEEEQPGPVGHLRGAIRRLGEPVIRKAVARAMKEMGAQFVLGEDIRAAMTRARKSEAKGYTYSYDMLGEAARTEADAQRYHMAYLDAIRAIAGAATQADIRDNPGISVKLSALYARYEEAQRDQVMGVLPARLLELAEAAKSARIGLNVDAEEADRLALSLDVIEAVVGSDSLAGWDGFGVVVQAYSPRAAGVLDWLYSLAGDLDRRFMVRLVKGAYWDTEIKRAQVEGLDGFPVFTAKAATDISYIANARKLLGMTDRIYPQFATHNAHSAAAILHMAQDKTAFEFQRLHGMGEALHDLVMTAQNTRCRIYAPVGAHRDLLAYLVRRLLENGANSSFVNKIVDHDVPPADVVADPFEAPIGQPLRRGTQLFAPERPNSKGWDLTHRPTRQALDLARAPWRERSWQAGPELAGAGSHTAGTAVINPANPQDVVGQVAWATPEDVRKAAQDARPWQADPQTRRRILHHAADLYEEAHAELFALLAREAGKTRPDAIAELREAVDFLRYYAERADDTAPRGVFACISPWNFPLAIFTGQVAAALATGNAVLAKPAEQTPLIAARAVALLHAAGVPRDVLQMLPGAGDVGAALTSEPRVTGVAFTGSTQTARIIHRAIATHLDPGTPFIAETGGLNAMVVDSTALPEQAVQAIIESAFQSAGQRCSALRCLYVQEDIAPAFLEMLKGAASLLRLGDPWCDDTDVGPVIDAEARDDIQAYLAAHRDQVLWQGQTPEQGIFVAPTILRVPGIAAMEREIFGPVLHVATFEAEALDAVIDEVNATGYGLTFGLQTRIDDRVEHVARRVHAGNIYVNRNQIGAIVGSQPFGGEGLSGTGPKAGGPLYMHRYQRRDVNLVAADWADPADLATLKDALAGVDSPKVVSRTELPGPTGESNVLTGLHAAPVLCLGPGMEAAHAQAEAVTALGGRAIMSKGRVPASWMTDLDGFGTVLWWGAADAARAYRAALADRSGPIHSLVTGLPDAGHVRAERHLCVDTTAAGGNAELLSGQD